MENAAATRMHNAASLQSRFVDPTHMNGIFYVYVSLLYFTLTCVELLNTINAGKTYISEVLMNTLDSNVRWFSMDARNIRDPVTGDNVSLKSTLLP